MVQREVPLLALRSLSKLTMQAAGHVLPSWLLQRRLYMAYIQIKAFCPAFHNFKKKKIADVK